MAENGFRGRWRRWLSLLSDLSHVGGLLWLCAGGSVIGAGTTFLAWLNQNPELAIFSTGFLIAFLLMGFSLSWLAYLRTPSKLQRLADALDEAKTTLSDLKAPKAEVTPIPQAPTVPLLAVVPQNRPAPVLAVSNISRAEIDAKLSGIPQLMRNDAGKAYVGKRVRWQGQISSFMRLGLTGRVEIRFVDSSGHAMWASMEESARVRLLATDETITVDGIISEPDHFTLFPADLIE
jgi:hypothetical protein